MDKVQDKASREFLVGEVSSEVKHQPDVFGLQYPYIRQVGWLKRISRDNFSDSARSSLGGFMTVFRVDELIAEVHNLVAGGTASSTDIEENIPFYDEIKSRADELISDLISNLDPYDFQDLVAAVLRAMGFRAVSSPPGRDRGVDVLAYPDALGFGKPRIKVQVKHRGSSVSGPDMRNFLATVNHDENGLFVSTGGFTKDAQLEAERARATVTLFDRDRFIELLIEHYEKLEPEFQAKIPLKKLWVPVNV